MSDRLITAEEARAILNEANLDGRLRTFHDNWDEDVIKIADNPDRWEIGSAMTERWARLFVAAPDLAATVIAQAEQIQRLQAEIEEFDTAPVVSTEEERKILNELGYLDAEDMEEK